MKVEIDLNEILHDEYGDAETFSESIRRQIVENLTSRVKKGIDQQINKAVSETISSSLAIAVKEQMPVLIDELMNAEYTPVTNYGSRGEATTFKNELIKTIHSQMIYKKSSYDSDKNAFTRAVDSTISELTKQFQKDFNEKVDGAFKAEALRVATTSILSKLGVPQK